jgi:hypothetical protein
MQRARDLHSQLLASERTNVQLQVPPAALQPLGSFSLLSYVSQVHLDSALARAKVLEKVSSRVMSLCAGSKCMF